LAYGEAIVQRCQDKSHVSFCRGPLVVMGIVAVVVLARQKSAAPPRMSQGCGKIVSNTDRFCRQCGNAVK
jgi:hypothetical protein